jgi:hypothetical protein
MKQRIAGLMLVVAWCVAVGPTADASASAPEFGRCLKQSTKSLSNYDSAKCVKTAGEDVGTEAEKLSKGNYQWFPGVLKTKFTASVKEGTIATLETVAGTKIICKGGAGGGEYTGLKSVGGIVLRFTGCETAGGQCNSAGELSGKVTTNELSGVLGIWQTGTTKTKDKPGIVFKPTTGETLVEFSCAGLSVKVRGGVILPVPGNAMKLSGTVKLAQAKGKQKPDKFVEGSTEILETSFLGGPYEPSGLAIALIQANEEKVEVSTVL